MILVGTGLGCQMFAVRFTQHADHFRPYLMALCFCQTYCASITALNCSCIWSWLRAENTFAVLWINMQITCILQICTQRFSYVRNTANQHYIVNNDPVSTYMPKFAPTTPHKHPPPPPPPHTHTHTHTMAASKTENQPQAPGLHCRDTDGLEEFHMATHLLCLWSTDWWILFFIQARSHFWLY